MKLKIFYLLVLVCAPSLIYAQDVAWPGNDLGIVACPNTVSVSGNTNGAAIHCTVSSAGDHTYQFTIVGPLDITISTCTSGYDTEIHLFNLVNGSCNGGAIASNDDGGTCGGFTSLLTMTSLASGTYVVIVEGWDGSEGSYDLDIIPSCPLPLGGIGAEQVWLTSELGVVGTSPVTSWTNQGGNTSVTTLTGGIGSQLNVAQPNFNFHNGVKNGGGYAGAFKQTFGPKTNLLTNEITMFVVTDGGQDLTLSLHTHSNGTNQYRCFGFRHGGLGALYSSGNIGNAYNGAATNENMNIYGMRGASNSSGENTSNGFKFTIADVGAFTTITNDYEIAVGFWPGYGHSNNTTEVIIYNSKLDATDFHIVESYLAIKYGVTLGANGVSMDYNSSSNTVVWSAGGNSGYGFDIAGISGDIGLKLDQKKSHSINGSSTTVFNDILTVVNGTSFAAPLSMTDKTSFIWGHNNGAIINTNAIVNYPTDNGETIQTIFQRKWKGQETGVVSDVVMEFNLSNVVGVDGVVGDNDLQHLRLLVDEDGDFSTGATSYSPSSFNNTTNIAYFEHDFTPTDGNPMSLDNGYFFTLGSINMNLTILPVQITSFTVNCETDFINKLDWETKSEQDNDYFIIEKSYDGLTWEYVAKIEGSETTSTSQNYNYSDVERSNNLMYYRLTQVDFDGSLTVLHTVKVECSNYNFPQIYPNPFDATLYVDFKTDKDYTIEVKDVLGKIVYIKAVDASTGNLQFLDLNEIQTRGLYYITLFEESNELIISYKIMKE